MSAASHWKVQLVAHLPTLPPPPTLVPQPTLVAIVAGLLLQSQESQQANDYNVCRLFYLNFMQIRFQLVVVPALYQCDQPARRVRHKIQLISTYLNTPTHRNSN